MVLNFSHKMNKDHKQNCQESRQCSAVQGSRISWAEHLLTLASSQESPTSMNAHSRSKIQSSCTSHCPGSGWGGIELPGRLLELNNKTPISLSEATENSLDFSYRREALTSTHPCDESHCSSFLTYEAGINSEISL